MLSSGGYGKAASYMKQKENIVVSNVWILYHLRWDFKKLGSSSHQHGHWPLLHISTSSSSPPHTICNISEGHHSMYESLGLTLNLQRPRYAQSPHLIPIFKVLKKVQVSLLLYMYPSIKFVCCTHTSSTQS
eukprot:c14373_g1_i1 orf=261-653(+)